jgi:hypothetical protein
MFIFLDSSLRFGCFITHIRTTLTYENSSAVASGVDGDEDENDENEQDDVAANLYANETIVCLIEISPKIGMFSVPLIGNASAPNATATATTTGTASAAASNAAVASTVASASTATTTTSTTTPATTTTAMAATSTSTTTSGSSEEICRDCRRRAAEVMNLREFPIVC